MHFTIGIFTVVCSEEPKHLNRVEGGGDVVLLQTSCFSPANDNVHRLVSMGISKLIAHEKRGVFLNYYSKAKALSTQMAYSSLCFTELPL